MALGGQYFNPFLLNVVCATVRLVTCACSLIRLQDILIFICNQLPLAQTAPKRRQQCTLVPSFWQMQRCCSLWRWTRCAVMRQRLIVAIERPDYSRSDAAWPRRMCQGQFIARLAVYGVSSLRHVWLIDRMSFRAMRCAMFYAQFADLPET
jgi:hypothetical protein